MATVPPPIRESRSAKREVEPSPSSDSRPTGLATVLSAARASARHGLHYVGIMCAVGTDAAKQFKVATLVVIGVAWLGVTANVAAIVVVLEYARAAVEGRDITWSRWTIDTSSQVGLLICASAFVGLSLAGTVAEFWAGWTSCWIARQYHKHSVRRFVQTLATCTWSPALSSDGNGDRAQILRAGLTDARICGLFCRLSLDCLAPIFSLAVALAALVAIHAPLTLAFCLAIAMYVLPSSLLGRRIARRFREFARLGPDANAEGRAYMLRFLQLSAPEPSHERWLNKCFDTGAIGAYMNAWYGRMLGGTQAGMLSQLFTIVCVLAILLAFGSHASNPSQVWAKFLAYLIALRFALRSIRNLTGRMVPAARYHLAVTRYFTFVARAKPIDARKPRSAPPAMTLGDENHEIPLNPGDWLWYGCHATLDRLTLPGIALCLARGDHRLAKRLIAGLHFCGAEQGFLPGTIEEHLAGKSLTGEGRKRMMDLLSRMMITSRLERLGLSLDSDLTHAVWSEIPDETRFLMALVTGLWQERQLYLLDAEAWCALTADTREQAEHGLGGATVVLVARQAGPPADVHCDVIALADRDQIWAVGPVDWFRHGQQALAEEFQRRAPAKARKRRPGIFADDVDDLGSEDVDL